MMRPTPRPARCWADPYARHALRDPYPLYRRIRDLGPAAWLPRRRLWAIGRYDDVCAALRADKILVSGKGVAANSWTNSHSAPITLTSDADEHLRRRRVLMRPLLPKSLAELRARLEQLADELTERLANGAEFDAMSDFASYLPVNVVAELVGLNEYGRRNMLRWAAAVFNALGVMNLRSLTSLPAVFDLQNYVAQIDDGMVQPGGWAARLFDAARSGELSLDEARAMVIDYVGPALDTTIFATGHMLWLLANNPGAYEEIRANPELVPGVVNEAVRLASPIRGFTRFTATAFAVGDTIIPEGQRVLVLYASANHDERHYSDPHRFDVHRNPRDHVGWGHGAHSCVGMNLARLEMEILLGAMIRRVERVEAGQPDFAWNNVLQGFKSLPARFHPPVR